MSATVTLPALTAADGPSEAWTLLPAAALPVTFTTPGLVVVTTRPRDRAVVADFLCAWRGAHLVPDAATVAAAVAAGATDVVWDREDGPATLCQAAARATEEISVVEAASAAGVSVVLLDRGRDSQRLLAARARNASAVVALEPGAVSWRMLVAYSRHYVEGLVQVPAADVAAVRVLSADQRATAGRLVAGGFTGSLAELVAVASAICA